VKRAVAIAKAVGDSGKKVSVFACFRNVVVRDQSTKDSMKS
jgi:hypothetical protein